MDEVSPISEHGFKDLIDTTQATSETPLSEYNQNSTEFTSILDLEAPLAVSVIEASGNSTSNIHEQKGCNSLVDDGFNQNDLQQLKKTGNATLSDLYDLSHQSTDELMSGNASVDQSVKNGNLLDFFESPAMSEGFITSFLFNPTTMDDNDQLFQTPAVLGNKLSQNGEKSSNSSSSLSGSKPTDMLDIFQAGTTVCTSSNTTNLLELSNEEQSSIAPAHLTKESSTAVDLLYGCKDDTSDQVNTFLNGDNSSSIFSGSGETLCTEDVLIPLSAKNNSSELDVPFQSKSSVFTLDNVGKTTAFGESNDCTHAIEDDFPDTNSSSGSKLNLLVASEENAALNGASLLDLQNDFGVLIPLLYSSTEETAISEALVNDQPSTDRNSVNNDIICTTDTDTLGSILEGTINGPKSYGKDDTNFVEMEEIASREDASHGVLQQGPAVSDTMISETNHRSPPVVIGVVDETVSDIASSSHEVNGDTSDLLSLSEEVTPSKYFTSDSLAETMIPHLSGMAALADHSGVDENETGVALAAACHETPISIDNKHDDLYHDVKMTINVILECVVTESNSSIKNQKSCTDDSFLRDSATRVESMEENLEGLKTEVDSNRSTLSTEVSYSVGDVSLKMTSENNGNPKPPPRRKKTKQKLQTDCCTDESQDPLKELFESGVPLDKQEDIIEKPNESLVPSLSPNVDNSYNECDNFENFPNSNVSSESLFIEELRSNSNADTDATYLGGQTTQLLAIDFKSEKNHKKKMFLNEAENAVVCGLIASNSPDEDVSFPPSNEMNVNDFVISSASEQTPKGNEAAVDGILQLDKNNAIVHPSTQTVQKRSLLDTIIGDSDSSDTSLLGESLIVGPVILQDSPDLIGAEENSVSCDEDELFGLNDSQQENIRFLLPETTLNKETAPGEIIYSLQLKSPDDVLVADRLECVIIPTENSSKTADLLSISHTTTEEPTLNDQQDFFRVDQFDSNPNESLTPDQEQINMADERQMKESVGKLSLETVFITKADASNDISESLNIAEDNAHNTTEATFLKSQMNIFEQPQTEQLTVLKADMESNTVQPNSYGTDTAGLVINNTQHKNDLISNDGSALHQVSLLNELIEPAVSGTKMTDKAERSDTIVTSKGEESLLLATEGDISLLETDNCFETKSTHSNASEKPLKSCGADAESSPLSSSSQEDFSKTWQDCFVAESADNIESLVQDADIPTPEPFFTEQASVDIADDTIILSGLKTESSNLTNALQSDTHFSEPKQNPSINSTDLTQEIKLETVSVETSPEFCKDVPKNENEEVAKTTTFAPDDVSFLHECNQLEVASANTPELSQDLPQGATSSHTIKVEDSFSSDIALNEVHRENLDVENTETTQPSIHVHVSPIQKVFNDVNVKETSKVEALCLNPADGNIEKKEIRNSEDGVDMVLRNADPQAEQNSLNYSDTNLLLANTTLGEIVDAESEAETYSCRTDSTTTTEPVDASVEEHQQQHEKCSSERNPSLLPSVASASLSESHLDIFEQPQARKLLVSEEVPANDIFQPNSYATSATGPVINISLHENHLIASDDSVLFQLDLSNELVEQSDPTILTTKLAEETQENDTTLTTEEEEEEEEESLLVATGGSVSLLETDNCFETKSTSSNASENPLKSRSADAESSELFSASQEDFPNMSLKSFVVESADNIESPVQGTDIPTPEPFFTERASVDIADDTIILSGLKTESSNLTNSFQSDTHFSEPKQNPSVNSADLAQEINLEAFSSEITPEFCDDFSNVPKNVNEEVAKTTNFSLNDGNLLYESNVLEIESANTPEISQDLPQGATSAQTIKVEDSFSSDIALNEVHRENFDVENTETTQPSTDVHVSPIQKAFGDVNVEETSKVEALCLNPADRNPEKKEIRNSENSLDVVLLTADPQAEQNSLNYSDTNLLLANTTLGEIVDAKTYSCRTDSTTTTESVDAAVEEHEQHNEKCSTKSNPSIASASLSEGHLDIFEQPQARKLLVSEEVPENDIFQPNSYATNDTGPVTNNSLHENHLIASDDSVLFQLDPSNELVEQSNPTILTTKLAKETQENDTTLTTKEEEEESLLVATEGSVSLLETDNCFETKSTSSNASENPLKSRSADAESSELSSSSQEDFPNMLLKSFVVESADNIESPVQGTDIPTPAPFFTEQASVDIADDAIILCGQKNASSDLTKACQSDTHFSEPKQTPSINSTDLTQEFNSEALSVEITPEFCEDVPKNEIEELAKTTTFAPNDVSFLHECNQLEIASANTPEISQDLPQGATSGYTIKVEHSFSSDIALNEVHRENLTVENTETAQPSTDVHVSPIQQVLSDANVEEISKIEALCLNPADGNPEKKEIRNSENSIDMVLLHADVPVEQNSLNYSDSNVLLANITLGEIVDAETYSCKTDSTTTTELVDASVEKHQQQHEKCSSESNPSVVSASLSESHLDIFEQPQAMKLLVSEEVPENDIFQPNSYATSATGPVINISLHENHLIASDDSVLFQLDPSNELVEQSDPTIFTKKAEETQKNDTTLSSSSEEESLLVTTGGSVSLLETDNCFETKSTSSNASENPLKSCDADAESSQLSPANQEDFPNMSLKSLVVESANNIESPVQGTDIPTPEYFVTEQASVDIADDAIILSGLKTESSNLTNAFQSDTHFSEPKQTPSINSADLTQEINSEAFSVEITPEFCEDVTKNENEELTKTTTFAPDDVNFLHESTQLEITSANTPEISQDLPQVTTSHFTMKKDEDSLSLGFALNEVHRENFDVENTETTQPNVDLDITPSVSLLDIDDCSETKPTHSSTSENSLKSCIVDADAASSQLSSANQEDFSETSRKSSATEPLSYIESVGEISDTPRPEPSVSALRVSKDNADDINMLFSPRNESSDSTNAFKNDVPFSSDKPQDEATEENAQHNSEKFAVNESASISTFATVNENPLPDNVTHIDNFDEVSNSDDSSSVFGSDHINVSDIDSSESENDPKQYDNVSQISLEFDDNPFSCQPPAPPPRASKKRKDKILSSLRLPTNTTALNVVPTTVFMDDELEENVSAEPQKQSFENFVEQFDVTEYESSTGFSEYREFVGEENDTGEQFMPFESGWDDIQLFKPSVEVMPVIAEESEPEEEYNDKNETEKENKSTLYKEDEEKGDLLSTTSDGQEATEINNNCENSVADVEDVSSAISTQGEENVLSSNKDNNSSLVDVEEITADCLSLTESFRVSSSSENDFHTQDSFIINNGVETSQTQGTHSQNGLQESEVYVSMIKDVINFILDNVCKATQQTIDFHDDACNEGTLSGDRSNTDQSSSLMENNNNLMEVTSSIHLPPNSSQAVDIFSSCMSDVQPEDGVTRHDTFVLEDKQRSHSDLELDLTLLPVAQPLPNSESERISDNDMTVKEESKAADTKDVVLMSPTQETDKFPKELSSESGSLVESLDPDKTSISVLQANEKLDVKESKFFSLVNNSTERDQRKTVDDVLTVDNSTKEGVSVLQVVSKHERAPSPDRSLVDLTLSKNGKDPSLISADPDDIENINNHEMLRDDHIEYDVDKSRTETVSFSHSELTDSKALATNVRSTIDDNNLSEINMDNLQNLDKKQITSISPTTNHPSNFGVDSSDLIDQSGDSNDITATQQTSDIANVTNVVHVSYSDDGDFSEENHPSLLADFVSNQSLLTTDQDRTNNFATVSSHSLSGDPVNEALKEIQENEVVTKLSRDGLPVTELGVSVLKLESFDHSQAQLDNNKDSVAGNSLQEIFGNLTLLEGSSVEPPIIKEIGSAIATDSQNAEPSGDENLMQTGNDLQSDTRSSNNIHHIDEDQTPISGSSLHDPVETPSGVFLVKEPKECDADALNAGDSHVPLNSSKGEDTPRTKKKLLLELDTSNDLEGSTGGISRKSSRTRYDTIGSIDLLSDSEEELDSIISPKSELSNDSILVSLGDEKEEDAPYVAVDSSPTKRRRSLVPPSALILSVALDDLTVKGAETMNNENKLQLVSEETVGFEEDVQLEGSVGSASEEVVPKQNMAQQDDGQKSPNTFSILQPTPPNDLNRPITWETVVICNVDYKVDASAIQPFKRVISHGGFFKEKSTIVEIFGRYLPDSSIPNYTWVIDNLFLYLLSTMELLVQDKEYVIVFFNNSVSKSHFPSTAWLKKNHSQIPPFLKKNLKGFYVVQSSFYLKTLIGLTRMFINRKAFRKLKYFKNHLELKPFIPIDFLFVPEEIARNHVQSNDMEGRKVTSKWRWW